MQAIEDKNVFISFIEISLISNKIHSRILEYYKKYYDVFEKNNGNILPKNQPYDCVIHL